MATAAPHRSRWRWLRWLVIAALVLFVANRLFGGGAGPSVEAGSALLVELDGEYLEAPEVSLIARLIGEERRTFLSALQVMRLAERDARIDTVVLRIRPLGLGWGKAQELRAAIEALRAAGRKTVAVLEIQDLQAHREYFVASAADRVLLHPSAIVPIIGLSAEYLHLGAFFDQFGIDFEVAKAGRFKSAVEFLTDSGMSDSAREMNRSLIDSISAQFVSGIAKSRGIEEARVRAAIKAGATFPAELQSYGLTDGEGGVGDVLEPFDSVVKAADYLAINPATLGFREDARFALVYASGNVVTGRGDRTTSGDPVLASDTIGDALEEAAEDPDIDAIVLRVDSPGGSALASEMIWQALRRARQTSGKPIVASFSDVAASGGYYVSAGADTIVSNGAALTGSIGVFLLRPELSKLLEKWKIGIEPMTRGPYADLALSGRPLSEATRKRFQALAIDTYRLFLERVGEGRGLETAAVDAVAQGRVWTGEQALAAGLVDRIGGLRTAVDAAKEQLGIAADSDVVLVAYPTPPSLAEQLSEALGVRIGAALQSQWPLPGPAARLHERLLSLASLPTGTPLAVLPFALDVH